MYPNQCKTPDQGVMYPKRDTSMVCPHIGLNIFDFSQELSKGNGEFLNAAVPQTVSPGADPSQPFHELCAAYFSFMLSAF